MVTGKSRAKPLRHLPGNPSPASVDVCDVPDPVTSMNGSTAAGGAGSGGSSRRRPGHPPIKLAPDTDRSANRNAKDGLIDDGRGNPIDDSMTILSMNCSNVTLSVFAKTGGYMQDWTEREEIDLGDRLLELSGQPSQETVF